MAQGHGPRRQRHHQERGDRLHAIFMHLGGLLLQPPASPIAISNLTPAIFASTRCIHDIHAHTTRHPLHTLLRPISAPLNHVSFLRLTSRRRRRICLFWFTCIPSCCNLLFLGLSCIISVVISLGFGVLGLVSSSIRIRVPFIRSY